jgi:hypothetical protein
MIQTTLQVRVRSFYKGEIIDKKFYDQNKELFVNQPDYLTVMNYLLDVQNKTLPNKCSYIDIDEFGKITCNCNVEEFP